MKQVQNFSFRSYAVELQDFKTHVAEGFAGNHKQLSPRFFYNERGSELFEQITRLPEYYPTETEKNILRDHASELQSELPDTLTIVEPGSGNSEKIEILFEQISGIRRYVPIEISGEHLRQRCEKLAERYPQIDFLAIDADYMDERINREPIVTENTTPLIFFPGSSLGNYQPEQACEVLRQFRKLAGTPVWMLIGVDLKKNPAILERAYNDSRGVTAAFNKNMIARMRDELAMDINPDDFEHQAVYNPDKGRVEMQLHARKSMEIFLNGSSYVVDSGEIITTEYSHKYSIDEFHQLASGAGFKPVRVFCDDQKLFSVHLMKAD